jgi:hypothetical protein
MPQESTLSDLFANGPIVGDVADTAPRKAEERDWKPAPGQTSMSKAELSKYQADLAKKREAEQAKKQEQKAESEAVDPAFKGWFDSRCFLIDYEKNDLYTPIYYAIATHACFCGDVPSLFAYSAVIKEVWRTEGPVKLNKAALAKEWRCSRNRIYEAIKALEGACLIRQVDGKHLPTYLLEELLTQPGDDGKPKLVYHTQLHEWLRRAYVSKLLTASETLVLSMLISYDKTTYKVARNDIWFSSYQIAEQSGMVRNTAMSAINSLIKKGLLVRTDTGGRGRGKSHHHRINYEIIERDYLS